MQLFLQQLAAGLASGAIYASLALALVLIYRATRIVNFAQGEMATFATFVAWSLTHHMSFWPAFLVTLVVAFAGGVALERVVIRPFENAPVLTPVIVTIGLALALNGLMSLIWGGASRQFPSAFSDGTVEIAGVIVGWQTLGTIGVTVAVVVLLAFFFRFTKVGLGLRAAALNPHASRLVGIRVGWMLALGWGFAAVLGAVAGMLIAPDVSLDPNMMQTILLY